MRWRQRELALRIVGEPSSDGHGRRSEIAMTLALRGPRLTLRWFWTGKRGASRQTPDAEFGRSACERQAALTLPEKS